MRIVIIEDEVQIREGLQKAIEKLTQHEVVGTAVDGRKGKLLVKQEKPDLIITDIRMPIMDGLTMLKELQEEGLQIDAILLTGYSEFEYARTAILLGVVDYLLKPVDLNNLMTTLNKAESKMSHQKQKEVSMEQLFWSYLTCDMGKRPEYKKYLENELKINSNTRLDLYLLEINSHEREEVASIRELVSKKAKMQIFDSYFLFPKLKEQEIIFGFIDIVDQLHITRFWEKRILPEVLTSTECFLSSECIFGLSELPEKVEQLRKLNHYAFELGNEQIITKDRVKEIDITEITYPMELETETCLAIRNGDNKTAEQLCNQFLQQIICKPASGTQIKEYMVTFSEIVYRTAITYLCVKQLEVSSQILMKKILESRTKKELIIWFGTVIRMLSGAEKIQSDTENQAVLEAITYIRNHYQKDITLTEVAEVLNISPEHLSRLFSQELGVNFVVFLRNFRISIAKRMLSSGKYKIKEIAEKVGYCDAKYFNKVFKSVCHMTPSEYQEGD
jgi:two-component system response regulator YesN